jgi:telomere length regulation protein
MDLLTQVNTSHRRDLPCLSMRESGIFKKLDQPKSAEDVLEILQNEPDYHSLIVTLQFLNDGGSKDFPFALGIPSPQATKILQVLVTEIVPNYWQLLKDSSLEEDAQTEERGAAGLDLLLRCFRSISGINAILSCLRTLIQASKAAVHGKKEAEPTLKLDTTIQVLCEALSGDLTLLNIWTASSSHSGHQTCKRLLSNELLVLIGSGKVTSLAAEAEAIVKDRTPEATTGSCWVAEGRVYGAWLAKNIAGWILKSPSSEDIKLCAELLTKGLRLGPPGKFLPWCIGKYSC